MTLLGNLSALPGSPQLHRWADWAELLCASSVDGALSVEELTEAIERRRDAAKSETEDDIESDEDDGGLGASLYASPGPSDPTSLTDGEGMESELDDGDHRRSRDIFRYLLDRQEAYGTTYPFDVIDGSEVTLRQPSDGRNLYLFLTVSASLKYVPSGADRSRLTSQFELLCVAATKAWLGDRAEVHLFGKSASKTTSRYKGLLSKKIDCLADDINEASKYGPDDFEDNDTGDHGLDIVGWFPSHDSLPGKFLFFGQCACTPKWVDKQSSSSAAAWSNVISMMVEPVNICYIPYDFRRPEGGWYKKASIRRSVLMDRRRLLYQLGYQPNGTGIPAPVPEVELDNIERLRNADLWAL
jgi:hypothetical protein